MKRFTTSSDELCSTYTWVVCNAFSIDLLLNRLRFWWRKSIPIAVTPALVVSDNNVSTNIILRWLWLSIRINLHHADTRHYLYLKSHDLLPKPKTPRHPKRRRRR